MNFTEQFKEIMTTQTELALATCTDHTPNVRIVSFYYDPAQPKVIYFTTFKETIKTIEAAQNEHVAFVSVPPAGSAVHARSNKVTMQQSAHPITDFTDHFIAKNESFAYVVQTALPMLELYELHLSEVTIMSAQRASETITL